MKNDQNDKGNKGNSPAMTCFTEPFLEFHHIIKWNHEVPELIKKVESSGDHRSLALITALVLEYHLDRILKAFFPRYQILLDRSEVSFSLKADILKALSFIPSIILNCVDVLRKIRNEFAHNLELDNLDKIPDGKKVLLKQINQQLTNNYDKESSVEEDFKRISNITIIQLRLYEPNVKLLREKIDDQKFIQELGQISFERLKEMFSQQFDQPNE